MSISENIKNNRKKAGYTQETLAEKLNVSVSAVSQWESGKTIPDISIIPTLCHLFQISSDVLLDINLQENNQEIVNILSEANKFSSRAKFEEAEKILSKGLLRFPNSYPIMSALMYVYYNIYMQCGEEKKKQYEDALMSLCNQIIDGCTDGEFRAGAIQILCFIYADKKDYAKAKDLAYKMPPMACCRETLLSIVTTGEEKIHHRKSEILVLLQRLCVILDTTGINSNNRDCEYSFDEQACLREKVISLIQLMFEEGDFGFFNCMFSSVCALQAKYYAAKKDAEKALEYLEKAKNHAIAFLNYSANEKYTSLILRDEKYGDYSTNSEQKVTEWVLEIAMKNEFDFLKNDAKYQELIEKLKLESV